MSGSVPKLELLSSQRLDNMLRAILLVLDVALLAAPCSYSLPH
jgi:hypothetical protein